MPKNPREKFKYVYYEKSFQDKIKSIFHHFCKAIIEAKKKFFGRWGTDFKIKKSNKKKCPWSSLKTIVRGFPSNETSSFNYLHKIMISKGYNYPFLISNTDQSDKAEKHWVSLKLFLFPFCGCLRIFIPGRPKKYLRNFDSFVTFYESVWQDQCIVIHYSLFLRFIMQKSFK